MNNILKSILIFMVCLPISFASQGPSQEISEVPPKNKRQFSCFCKEETCQCCITISAPRIKFEQIGCLEAVYIKDDTALLLKVKLNGNTLWYNKISGKNPPPICVPLPQFPFIRICLILRDIYFDYGYLHMCPELEVRIPGDFTILVFTFDCVEIGNNGVTFVKPEQVETTTMASTVNMRLYEEVIL